MKERVPPGQVVTNKFPVLQYGEIPNISLENWAFKTSGDVEKELTVAWNQFLELPKAEITADMHCVTKWSKLDNKWEGVRFKTIYDLTKPKTSAKYILAHSFDGYSANIPLNIALNNDVILAYKHDGQLLTAEHGKPVRLVVPKRYGWKSAKWITEIEFLNKDKRGYWEENGYHNNGDPWKNERFKWQEECPQK